MSNPATDHGARGGGSTPLVRVRGTLSGALDAGELATFGEATLARFLGAQRWFGAKGETPRSVRLRDAMPLFAGAVLARVAVELEGGRAALYQLPLVVLPLAAAGSVPERAILARVAAGRAEGVVVDAVEDAGFRAALLDAVESGATLSHGDLTWSATPIAHATAATDGGARGEGASTIVRGEQSNTSIVYGERAILKLYRRLEPGVNPDVEIGEFLTSHARFPHVPPLLGAIRIRDASGVTDAGMLQAFVPSTGDGWEYALGGLERYVAAPRGATPSFARDAARLGSITRGLHEALASGEPGSAFEPIPVAGTDLRMWLESAGRSIVTGLDLLETRWKDGALPPPLGPQVRALVARRGEAYAYAAEVAAGAIGGAGARIRHHGDYHLGQTLRTASGDFVVLDFEGEPARPLEERRRPHSALRDVAGMLRSFDYAASAVGERLLAGPTSEDDARERVDDETRRSRALAWGRAAREAFVGAYLGTPDGALPSFLPAERDDALRLVSLFEIEKAFYELAYELNNRPDWVAIPLRGIVRLLDEAP